MFLSFSTTKPVYVEGRKFVEETIKSRFERGDASVTTIYMDDKPLIKTYNIFGKQKIKNVWRESAKEKTTSLDITG